MSFLKPILNETTLYRAAHPAVWQGFIACRMAKHASMGLLEEVSTAI